MDDWFCLFVKLFGTAALQPTTNTEYRVTTEQNYWIGFPPLRLEYKTSNLLSGPSNLIWNCEKGLTIWLISLLQNFYFLNKEKLESSVLWREECAAKRVSWRRIVFEEVRQELGWALTVITSLSFSE